MTDERNTCRRYRDDGTCAEDDYVFSLAEQHQKKLSEDVRVNPLVVKAGHVEIVGSANTAPLKLIDILQAKKFMNATPAESTGELAQLLKRLY